MYKRKRSFSRNVRRKRSRSTRRNKRSYGSFALKRKPFARVYRNSLNKLYCNTVLIYNDNISINPVPEGGVLGFTRHVFRSNSLQDPDQTGTGHQPMFFDTYAGVYSKYRVTYAKITVRVINHFVNTEAATNYSYRLFIAHDRQAGTDLPSNMTEMLELGGANLRYRFVSPSLTGKLPILTLKGAPNRIAGLTKWDDQLLSAINTSPAVGTNFIIGIASADGVTDPPSVTLNVRIKYYCQFSDRTLAQPQN